MRILLIILVAFVSVTSSLSGLLMLLHPGNKLVRLPLELLSGTTFDFYFLPGFILAMVVGNTNLIALMYIFEKDSKRYDLVIGGGVITEAWIIRQMIMVEQIHWLHIVYLAIGVLIILLAYILQKSGKTPKKVSVLPGHYLFSK